MNRLAIARTLAIPAAFATAARARVDIATVLAAAPGGKDASGR